jgi:hypothetical protein
MLCQTPADLPQTAIRRVGSCKAEVRAQAMAALPRVTADAYLAAKQPRTVLAAR